MVSCLHAEMLDGQTCNILLLDGSTALLNEFFSSFHALLIHALAVLISIILLRLLLPPTRGRFQCVLSQFNIGFRALWNNYIWEEIHKIQTVYNLGNV